MITKAQSFVTSDQQTFLTLEAAQGHELERLYTEGGTHRSESEGVPEWIWKHRDKVVEILTMKPTSRPRARKANGATKKRGKSVADINAAANRELYEGKMTPV